MNMMDKLLREIFETEADKIKGIEDIEVPDSQEILKKFENNLIIYKADRKRRIYKISKRIINAIMTVTMASMLFFIVFMSMNINRGIAVSDSLSKSIYEFKNGIFSMVAFIGENDGEKDLPYPIPMLVNLPADYLPPKIEYMRSGSFYYIDQLYRSNNGNNSIIIRQRNIAGKESRESDEDMEGDIIVKDKDIEVMGKKGTITCLKSGEYYKSIIKWHDDVAEYEIIAPFAEDEALKLIKNIKMSTITQ